MAERAPTRMKTTSVTSIIVTPYFIVSNGVVIVNSNLFDYSLLKKVMPLVTPFIYNVVIPITGQDPCGMTVSIMSTMSPIEKLLFGLIHFCLLE